MEIARHGVRMGRRQADGMDFDAGHQRGPRKLRAGAEHSAGQRARHLRSTWAAVSAASQGASAREGLICAKLAKMANAPVKLMLDRKEEHLATGNRPSAASHIKAGVSADGTITAFDAETWGTGGAGATAGFPLPYIYQFPNRRRAHKDVYINAGQQRPMRAPGHPQGSFNTEILMDELADLVKMDPVEFRIKNLPPRSAERDVARLSARGRDGIRLGQAASRPATRRPGRSRPAWVWRSTRGAAAAADRRRRTARSHRTAASLCAPARRISAPARARLWRWSRPKRWDFSRRR